MIKYYNSLSWRLGTHLKNREPGVVGKDPTRTSLATKSSWLLSLLMAFMLLAGFNSEAQMSSYSFTQTSGTYTALTGGTLLASSAAQDSYASPVTGIGFDFVLDGVTYTQFSASSNGWVRLGSTIASAFTTTPISTTNSGPAIAFLSRDAKTGASGITYLTSGTAPNRVLTIEYIDYQPQYNSTTNLMTVQVKLFETSNNIQIVYGGTTKATTYTGQVGVVGTVTTNYSNRTTTTDWSATTAGTANSSSMTWSATVGPASGLTYTWTPPSPCTGTPVAGAIAPITRAVCPTVIPGSFTVSGFTTGVTGITFSWFESTDNINFVAVSGGTGATTSTYTPPAFSGTTTYYKCRVTCSNGGGFAETASVSVTPPTSPLTQASNAVATLNSNTGFSVGWTNGSGTRRIVVLSNTVITDPVDGSGAALVASSVYAGSGQQIMYDGTGTSVAISGLTCGTSYNVKVYDYLRCGAGPYDYYYNVSSGTNAISSSTTSPSTASLPANNNFTGFTGANLSTVFPGWYEGLGTAQNLNPAGSTSLWSNSAVFTGQTTAKVNLYLATRNEWIISPRVNLTGNSRIAFKAAITDFASANADAAGMQGTDDKVKVLISTDGCGASWTTLYTFEASNTTTLTNALQNFVIDLTAYTGQTVQLAFQATDGPLDETPDYDFHIGDIKIELIPSCVVSSGLTVAFDSSTSANLSWTAASPAPAVGYEWAFTTSATPPASGTATTNLTAAVSSLLPATTYYLHVRSVCVDGSDYSVWNTSAGFVPPVITSVPWSEGFATTTLPAQWSATAFSLSSTANVGANPGNALVLNLWSLTTTGSYTTPNLGTVAANQLFSFDYKIIDYSGTTVPGAGTGTYTLAVSTNYGATYSTLDTFSNDGVAGWRNKSYSLAAYAGMNVKFRLTAAWTSGDYYIGFDNFSISALCEGTPTGGAVTVASQSVCPTYPVAPIGVTGASVDAGITYQWEESTNAGSTWANATGGTGATTLSFQPPVFAGTTILYRLKTTCTASSLFAYSDNSEINNTPRAVPFNENFDVIENLVGWSTSGFGVGTGRGALGNPSNNAFGNLWSSTPSINISTANYGPITAGQALSFDYQFSNYSTPYASPAVGSGTITVFISTDCGITYTTLETISNDGTDGYKTKVISLASYVGQNVVVRFLGTWITGDYDLSLDNIGILIPAPIVDAVNPISVCQDTEGLVTITGNYFNNTSSVRIGSTETVFTVVDANTITFTVPIGAGTGQITVTTPGGSSTSAGNVTVYPFPTNNPITGPDDKVCSNGTLQLTPGGAGADWMSSNTNVATVDGNGLVTGVAAGMATISFSITDFGCTSTQTYEVEVFDAVVITTQAPLSQSIQTGTTGTITIAASGSGLTYQWYIYDIDNDVYNALSNDATYSGVTSTTLSISNTPETLDGSEYYCEVSGSSPCASVNTGSTIISVGSTAIATAPVDQFLCTGGSATFTAGISGDVDTIVWYEDDGSGFVPVGDSVSGLTYSGEDTATLVVSGITTANTGYSYIIEVNGPANTVYSGAASIIVSTPPVVNSVSPTSAVNCAVGGTANFVASTSGTVSDYVWSFSTTGNPGTFTAVSNGTPVGASYSTLLAGTLGVTTTPSTPAGVYYYQLVAAGNAPCTASNAVGFTLEVANPTITGQPVATSVLRGGSKTFTVVSPTAGATYKWQRATTLGGTYTDVANATPVGNTYSGASTATLTVTTSATTVVGGGNYYRAVVSYPASCSVNSTGALLTVFDYCTIPTSTSTLSYFDAFSTAGGITNITNNTSGFSTGGYGNFTAQSASQYKNSTVNFTTTLVGTTTGVAIWVDWNQDGTFATTERVYNAGTYVSAASGSFVVPGTALTGPTRMRIEMDYNATNPAACPATGGRREVEDYTFIVVDQPACSGTPVAATIASNLANVCFSGSVVLTASGLNTIDTGLTYQWYNTGGLISGATASSYTTPVISAPETYYFKTTCTNGGLTADSNSITIGVSSPEVVSNAPATRCGTGTVDLGATVNAGATAEWYAAATGGTPLYTGATFTTPTLTASTTYYVQANQGSTLEFAGKASSSGSDGNYLGTAAGLVFNATSPVSLASTVIYPVGTGTVTVALYNSSGVELMASSAVSVTGTGAATPVTVPLNFMVPTGTGYRLLLKASSGITGLVRDFSGNVYPYSSTNASITGGYAFGGTSTTYYFFYNMQFSKSCASGRTAVAATVTAPPALTLSSAASAICIGDATTTPVSISSTVGDYDSYTWSPSTGVSGSAMSGYTFNPTTTTTYTLTATNSVDGCANTVDHTVTVNPLPAAFPILPAAPVVCDNGPAVLLTAAPVSGTATVSFGTNLISEGTTATQFTANITGVPAGATITSAQLQFTNVSSLGGSYRSEIRVALSGAHTLAATQISTEASSGLITPDPSVTLSGFTATSGAITLLLTETYNDGGDDASFGTAQLVLNYTATPVNVTWSPLVGLYTDAAMTTSYSGGASATVYAHPASQTTYEAKSTNPTSCFITSSVTVNTQAPTVWYADTDGDNFGNDAVTILTCDQPIGYVAVGGDCNDMVASIFPGATEICYDGILQNCSGTLTSGCAVITATLRAENCNSTLTSLDQVVRGNLYSQSIPSGVSVTGYRFKVTNLITLQERIVERSNYVFQLTYTDFAEYDTPYSVEVALRLNTEWMTAYGSACTITTPGVPNTVLTATSCGATLAQMNNIIRAVVVPSALQYEYNVALIEGGIPVETTTLVRPGESFNLLQLSNISIKYASEYSVTIRVQVPTSAGPQWSTVAGAACSVFTPAAPEASIEGCGTEAGIAPANMNSVVYASPVGGATNYRFTLIDGMGYSQVYTTPSRFFRLSNFDSLAVLTLGGTYSVTVEVEIYGNFYPGKDCNILVPGGSGRPVETVVRTNVKPDALMGEFKAVAYPNPFGTSFAIDLRSNSTTAVTIAVYDMAGRLLEAREFNFEKLASHQLGDRYPAGVYSVIVTQEQQTQTIRVVKQ